MVCRFLFPFFALVGCFSSLHCSSCHQQNSAGSSKPLLIVPLGKVGSTFITNLDVEFFRTIEVLINGRRDNIPKEQCLKYLMDQELQWMALQDQTKGDINDDAVEEYMERIEKQRSMAPGDFKKILITNGIPWNFFRKYFLCSMFWQQYVQERTRDKIHREAIKKETQEKAHKIIQEYRQKWSCPYYTVLEISIPFDPREGSLGKAKAFEIMNVILQEMQKNKKTFDELAKKYSFNFLGSTHGVMAQRPEKDFPKEFIPFLQKAEMRKIQFIFLESLSCLVSYVVVQRLDTQHLLASVQQDSAPGSQRIYQNVFGSIMQETMDHFSKELLSDLRRNSTIYRVYPENLQKIP